MANGTKLFGDRIVGATPMAAPPSTKIQGKARLRKATKAVLVATVPTRNAALYRPENDDICMNDCPQLQLNLSKQYSGKPKHQGWPCGQQ